MGPHPTIRKTPTADRLKRWAPPLKVSEGDEIDIDKAAAWCRASCPSCSAILPSSLSTGKQDEIPPHLAVLHLPEPSLTHCQQTGSFVAAWLTDLLRRDGFSWRGPIYEVSDSQSAGGAHS